MNAAGKILLRFSASDPKVRYPAIAFIYLLLISMAELITTYVDPLLGVICHSVIMAGLLFHSSIIYQGPLRRFLVLLSIAPLIRILSLAIPLTKLGLPMIYWYLIIGALLAVGAIIAGKIANMGWRRIGWSLKHWPLQIMIGCVGLVLGLVEYWILRPGPLAPQMNIEDILISIFILLIFTGVLEEFIFRGLLQSASMQLMGKTGLIYIALLFSVLHMGYHSIADLVFVLLVGLFFGWIVWKTHSLLGASLAHGIANIALYVFFPFFLGGVLPQANSPVTILTNRENTPIYTEREFAATERLRNELPPESYRIDEGDAGFLFRGESIWRDFNGGSGSSYLWAFANQWEPDVVVTWLPSLQGCGKYVLMVFIPDGNGLTSSAKYQIRHRIGATSIIIRQADFAGKWVDLGVFEFESGADNYVQLSNLTGEDPKLMRWVAFDSMRWDLLGSCSIDG